MPLQRAPRPSTASPETENPFDMSSITEETLALRLPLRVRLWSWVTHLPNWHQLARFLGVGAVGYGVNLVVYAFFVHSAGVDYRGAAIIAFMFALATTFVLNRHYTFKALEGQVHHQAWKYLLVNVAGLATNLIVLQILVDGLAVAKVPSEALAAAAAAPVNYIGQRVWVFATQR